MTRKPRAKATDDALIRDTVKRAYATIHETPTPRDTQAAYDWLRRRGGTGCFVANGRMIAAGSSVSDDATIIAHGEHSTAAWPVWNALRLARRVEFFASQSFECVRITAC